MLFVKINSLKWFFLLPFFLSFSVESFAVIESRYKIEGDVVIKVVEEVTRKEISREFKSEDEVTIKTTRSVLGDDSSVLEEKSTIEEISREEGLREEVIEEEIRRKEISREEILTLSKYDLSGDFEFAAPAPAPASASGRLKVFIMYKPEDEKGYLFIKSNSGYEKTDLAKRANTCFIFCSEPDGMNQMTVRFSDGNDCCKIDGRGNITVVSM
ncbi:hypothetical protein [Endozoicomonas sp. Mp262]|uniref:hypothetical protein n=1 Tax=Endozoicomonas sp. Mp262 TaxID=2919499 RepID=UPI0021D9B0E6